MSISIVLHKKKKKMDYLDEFTKKNVFHFSKRMYFINDQKKNNSLSIHK